MISQTPLIGRLDPWSRCYETYRRVILNVSGAPVEPPAGTIGIEEDLSKPITLLSEQGAANFSGIEIWRQTGGPD